jgi:hypothetical protein
MKRTASTASAVASPVTAEGVLATINAPLLGDNPLISGVVVDSNITATPGLGATAITLRVRRNTLTGAIVGTALVLPVTASAVSQAALTFLDTTPSTTYVVTIQQSAGPATAAGAYNHTTTVTAS